MVNEHIFVPADEGLPCEIARRTFDGFRIGPGGMENNLQSSASGNAGG
jgi:hypothetical protein